MSANIEAVTPATPIMMSNQSENDVSGLNVRAVYDYLLRHDPDNAIKLFDNLPGNYGAIENPEIELIDENSWVSSELFQHVLTRAKELLNDPEAPYHIGFESIAERDFGYIQKVFFTTFGNPAVALKRINHLNSQFNSTKVVETIYSSPARAVVRLHWKNKNGGASADTCRYNRGIYSAIPTLWNRPPATIGEPYCQFAGDPYCQFNIDFHFYKRSVATLFSSFRTRKSQLYSAIEQIDNDKLVLKKRYDEVQNLNLQLADKVEKLKAINTASNLLVSQENTDEILQTTMRFVVNVMQFDRAVIMLTDNEQSQLEFKYAVGADPGDIETHLNNYVIPLDKEDNILARAALSGRPQIIQNVETADLHMDNIILANFSVASFVLCPLLASGGIIGILAADRSKNDRKIEESDLDDLAIFANTIAETLLKARLTGEIEGGYLNTVKALVQAIEENDSYTRGHSERVADVSVNIGKEMGLSKQELEYLRFACLLHDVGKIGVPESIVQSPRSLTKTERDLINLHPLKGAQIVAPIDFLRDHIHIIRNHHEWYDGTGYPDGLAGDDIPLTAQIVTVSDAFDAMTSTRSYRQGMPLEEATRQIDEGSGTQFSPKVVAAYHRIITNTIRTRPDLQ